MTYTITPQKETDLYIAEESLRGSFQAFQGNPYSDNLPYLLQEAFTLKSLLPDYKKKKKEYLLTHHPDPFIQLETWEAKQAHLHTYTTNQDKHKPMYFRSSKNDLEITEHDIMVSISSLLILLKY